MRDGLDWAIQRPLKIVKRTKSLAEEKNYALKLSENCSMTVTGLKEGDLDSNYSWRENSKTTTKIKQEPQGLQSVS